MTNDASSVLRAQFGDRGRQPRHGGRLGDLAVAQGAQDFEDFAPGGERPAVVALVLVHRLHEEDLFVAVIAFTGGGVNLPPAFALLSPVLAAAPLDRHGNRLLAPLAA